MATKYRYGWQRDLPDVRDFDPGDSGKVHAVLPRTPQHKAAEWLHKTTQRFSLENKLPPRVDLRDGFSPVEDQGDLGSCTANAGVGLLEYYERRAFGTFINASRLFLYKVTRKLNGVTGDTGASLRSTMKAMILFGVLPEEYFPYDASAFDNEPTAFDYAYAANYRSLAYFRLDQPGMAPAAILDRIKTFAAAGLPAMFGFSVCNNANQYGEFAFPSKRDRLISGHAIVMAGYDDARQIGACKGALKIRNSWGENWGEGGYGWLPYDYVLRGLAVDFWSVFRADYIGEGQFQ